MVRSSDRVKGRVSPPSRVGLALAGGGPLGGIYELGALLALSESIEGVDFNELDVYVGVSAGGFIAAGLANGLTPERMRHMFIESDTAEEPFAPELLLKPAFREYAMRALSVPPLLLASIWNYLANPWGQSFFESFQRLSRAIPTGIFNITGIERFLSRTYSAAGRSNDFRTLRRKLFLVATDLDSGESVVFGSPGWDHVPISTAVQASAALPGMFPPVEIEGHHYVDGALKKTLHASVALKEGANLVLCVNPLVPFDSELAVKRGAGQRHRLVDGGLPVVLAQTFRSIIHSRMLVGLSKYKTDYRNADVVLFEPNSDDAEMFFTNMFSYSSRRHLCEHAYQKTRTELYRRRHELGPILARHGIRIRLDLLKEKRSLIHHDVGGRAEPEDTLLAASHRLGDALDELKDLLKRRQDRARKAA
ncbi:MAG: patatin family protein [Betaproteobacteria bacterium]|nr:patatin family protein [Betaproteobacteria bacterium]